MLVLFLPLFSFLGSLLRCRWSKSSRLRILKNLKDHACPQLFKTILFVCVKVDKDLDDIEREGLHLPKVHSIDGIQ